MTQAAMLSSHLRQRLKRGLVHKSLAFIWKPSYMCLFHFLNTAGKSVWAFTLFTLLLLVDQLLCRWATDLMSLAMGQGQLNPSNKNYKHSLVSGCWINMFQGFCVSFKHLSKNVKKKTLLWKCLGCINTA